MTRDAGVNDTHSAIYLSSLLRDLFTVVGLLVSASPFRYYEADTSDCCTVGARFGPETLLRD